MTNTKTHFHTFDALRFFSFLLVFLHHSPFEKPAIIEYFTKSGGIGVSFFFVLSGFLITYLLLNEKKSRESISLKNFFIRRILRIWPLFYAMILFAFLTPFLLSALNFSFSDEGYEPNWLMSVLFLENYKMMLEQQLPDVSPLPVMWSLCIEEHFYIIWGLCLYYIPCKKVPLLLLISIVIANSARIFYYLKGIPTLDLFSNLDFFAFGAIPAYWLLFSENYIRKFEKIRFSVRIMLVFITLVIVIISPHIELPYINLISMPVLAILFSMLILFTITEKNSIFISQDSVLSKLGIYTYGLYLIHTIVINLVVRLSPVLSFQMNWLSGGLVSLILTILISIASYNMFERQFLKLKKYFY